MRPDDFGIRGLLTPAERVKLDVEFAAKQTGRQRWATLQNDARRLQEIAYTPWEHALAVLLSNLIETIVEEAE